MATKKPITLEDYIDQYLKDRNDTRPKSYEEFIMRGGRGSAIVANEGKVEAQNRYARSLSSYGKRAESLAGSGLSNSGYADYLNSTAKRKMQRGLDLARGGALSIEAENKTAYTDYLTELAEESDKKMESVIKRLEDSMLTDYDRVYDLALRLGLSDKNAENVAKITTETAIKKLSDKAILEVVDKRLTREKAEELAKSLGLPKSEVERIGGYAEIINQSTDYNEMPEGYLDYLKELLGK